MSTVQEIEAAIEQLRPEEFLSLVEWIDQRRADEWDRQMQTDARNGNLDTLWKRALVDIDQGRVKSLDEFLDHP